MLTNSNLRHGPATTNAVAKFPGPFYQHSQHHGLAPEQDCSKRMVTKKPYIFALHEAALGGATWAFGGRIASGDEPPAMDFLWNL